MLSTKKLLYHIVNELPTLVMATARWQNTTAYQGRIEDNLVRFIRVGCVIFVCGRFKASTAISSGAPIATGLPSPMSSTGIPLCGSNSAVTQNVPMGVSQYGSLVPLTALASGTYYAVSGVYFTA